MFDFEMAIRWERSTLNEDVFVPFLTDKVVGWKGICIPNLKVKSCGNFLLWLVPWEETGLRYEKENDFLKH